MTKTISFRPTNEGSSARFTGLAGDKKHGEFFEFLMDHYESTTASGEVQISSKFNQVKAATNRILTVFAGVEADFKLSEDGLRANFEERLQASEEARLKAESKARDALEHSKELDQKLQAAEGMATAYGSVKDQLDDKKNEIAGLKIQLGELTSKLKDLPNLESELSELRIKNAKLETAVEEKELRLEDFKKFHSSDNGIQLDA